VKQWVTAAIRDEEQCPPDQMWKKERSADWAYKERLRRIKFLRKHSNTHPDALIVAKRLESCEPGYRCLSGACPECGRLLQRWFVRRSKKFIAGHIALPWNWLVGVSIVPYDEIIRPGQLSSLDVVNMQRRLKYVLKKTKMCVALGAVDFSFNEDREGKYPPFWSPHFYLITSTENKGALSKELRKVLRKTAKAVRRANSFWKTRKRTVPRPVYVSSFQNNAYRRSYALKMDFYRRTENRNGRLGKERLELFIYLDKIGFARRVTCWGAKPVVNSSRVKIVECGH
jgi:hypothetical protein